MKSLTLSIDEQLHRELRIAAAHAEKSLSGFVSHLIVQSLAESSREGAGVERTSGFPDRDAQVAFGKDTAHSRQPATFEAVHPDPADHRPSQAEAIAILRSLIRHPMTDEDGRPPSADECRA